MNTSIRTIRQHKRSVGIIDMLRILGVNNNDISV